LKAVEKLHRRLEAAGYDVWRDKRRLETDWSAEIAMALAKRDVICLMWSGNSAESKWVRHEWLTARALERPIIPCLFPRSPDVPKPLYNLEGIKFDDADQGVNKLIKRLGALTAKARRLKYDFTILPASSHIPFNPNPAFLGRELDLVELYLKLIGNLNKIGTNHVGLVGLGGVGKTQLAVEFAHRFSFGFEDGVYWVQAANSGDWLQQFVRLARDYLHLKVANPESPDANRQYLIELKAYCKAHPQMLIVMDNVADPRSLHSDAVFFAEEGITPLTLGANVLFTTRARFQIPRVAQQRVEQLSEEAAYRLLTSQRSPQSEDEKQHAQSICNAVGNLPLALVLIGSFLAKYDSVSFGDYREDLEKNKLGTIDSSKITPEELATRHETAVEVTLNSQWAMLKDERARGLFQLAGFFPEAAIISKGRLGLLAGIEPGKTRTDRPLDEAFLLLRDLTLVEEMEDGSSIRLHPLVHDFARRLTPEAERAAFKSEAATHLRIAYEDASRLESEYAARGIDEVIRDNQVGIEWIGQGSPGLHDMELLLRLLERERHNLRPDPQLTETNPVSLPQQLHYRAQNMGMTTHAEMFFEAARRGSRVGIRTTAVSRIEDPALIRTFKSPDVLAAGLSNDAKIAVSAHHEAMAIVWDVESGSSLRVLKGHTDRVTSVVVSPDGVNALSGSHDKKMILWETASGKSLRIFETKSKIQEVSLSGDGQRAACGSDDGTLIVWEISTGKSLVNIKAHTNSIQAVSLNRDGSLAVSGGSDQRTILWSIEKGTEIRKLRVSPINAVCFSADDQRLLTGSYDGTLTLWDVKSGTALRTFKGHGDWVNAVSLSLDGRRALSGSIDRNVILWDVDTGKQIRAFDGHTWWVFAASLSGDGRRALTGSSEMILWDTENLNQPALSGDRSNSASASVSISTDGRHALSLSIDALAEVTDGCGFPKLKAWDVEAGTLIDSQIAPSVAAGLSLSHDGRWAVGGTPHNTLVMWNVKSDRVRKTFTGHTDLIESSSLGANDSLVLTGSRDNSLILWEIKSGKPLRTFKGHKDWVNAVALSQDGRRGLSGSNDKTLRLWDIDRSKAVRVFKGHKEAVNDVKLSTDGRRALSGSTDKTMILWDVETGKQLRIFEGHSRPVYACSFCPDGKSALSGSYDRSVILWDLDSGKAMTRLWVKNPVTHLAQSGNRFIIGDPFGLVQFFELSDIVRD